MAKFKQSKPKLKSKDKVLVKKKSKLLKPTKIKRKNILKGSNNFTLDVNKNFDSDDSGELSESELLKGSEDDTETEVNDDELIESSNEDEVEKHKRDLEKLKQTDPEFYNFLQENDKKLLQFNLSDEELEESDKSVDEAESEVHKPVGSLDVASDESDFEAEDKPEDDRVITLKILKQWQSDLHSDRSNKTIITVMQAFHAALKTVSPDEDDDEVSYYKVEGSAVFNGVIQICVLELGPAIRRFLGLYKGSKQPPHKCKKFVKIKNALKTYFNNLLKLLLGVTSSNIQTVLLKHLHYMSSLLISFPNITKSMVKRLIGLWGTADDTVRILAFFCILRITTQQTALLDTILKSMYMTYVKNTKFVSFKGLSMINFMRRSLVEVFSLDTNVSYSHVFLYIRQLAIQLRNAITANKKENVQAVYNWQFVNSLRLWGNLLSATYHKPMMQQLVYPFVQVCIGTLRLVPTAQYYPLRFHVTQVLIDLSKETGVFIPVLPFLLEVLTSYDFNKKHQKVSMKPLHFTCLLRVSKSQLQENGFKDMVIEMIYGQVLEYLASQSHKIAFQDLSLLCIIQIKKFMKSCRNPNYTRKFKQILEKVQQNSQFIEKERSTLTVKLTDFKQIEGWESQIRNKGTPLQNYYDSWNKLRTIKKNKQLTNNEELGDYRLPTIKKGKKTDDKGKKSDGPVELFPSDSEDEDDDKPVKKRRGKRGSKTNSKKHANGVAETVEGDDHEDIVEDIKLEDWS